MVVFTQPTRTQRVIFWQCKECIATNTYTYDSENRLITATTPTHNASYVYDPFGRRISKTVDGVTTKFLYDGDQIIAEYDGSDNLTTKYINGASIDETIRMDRGANSYYYHYDGLGSVTNLTNATGSTVESYTYDVFGKPSATSSVGNAKMFTGRDYDQETGLYYYRARMYSPELGRFLQTDPIGYKAGFNLYTYCSNDPINFIDPMGLCKEGNKGNFPGGNMNPPEGQDPRPADPTPQQPTTVPTNKHLYVKIGVSVSYVETPLGNYATASVHLRVDFTKPISFSISRTVEAGNIYTYIFKEIANPPTGATQSVNKLISTAISEIASGVTRLKLLDVEYDFE